jgi:hypothetical protein
MVVIIVIDVVRTVELVFLFSLMPMKPASFLRVPLQTVFM